MHYKYENVSIILLCQACSNPQVQLQPFLSVNGAAFKVWNWCQKNGCKLRNCIDFFWCKIYGVHCVIYVFTTKYKVEAELAKPSEFH